MSITNIRVESTQATRLFLATGEQAVTTMFFCNTSDVDDCLVDIFVNPNGIPPGTSSTQIINSLSLPKSETFVFDAEKLILDNDDEIWAKATVNNIVVATISSVRTS
jgi:hypothetical protein